MDNNNDNVFPYINWDYIYYIGPAVAVGLILCMLATYCCQQCFGRRRGYEDSYFSSTVSRRRRNNSSTQGRRANLFGNRPTSVYHQFIPWNSSRRQNRRNQTGGQYQSAQQNGRAVTGTGQQTEYYPPATNPLFTGRTSQVHSIPVCL